jgi:hypothetical protein
MERPIIFSGPMVRAILEGRKTQTRRVIKIPSEEARRIFRGNAWCDFGFGDGHYLKAEYESIAGGPGDTVVNRIYCPFGVPGDRLWVRESIRRKHNTGLPAAITYSADDSPCVGVNAPFQTYGRAAWKWKRNSISSRFMPRWASRITLKVTDVRAQRVQDISTEDVIAEGVDVVSKLPVFLPQKLTGTQLDDLALKIAQAEFKTIWDSINAKRGYGWDENPWVWAITFKRIKPKGGRHDRTDD